MQAQCFTYRKGRALLIVEFEFALGEGGLGIPVPDKEHADQGQDHEDHRIGKEGAVAEEVDEHPRENGRGDLSGHGGGVVQPGVGADRTPPAHLHHHGIGVDVDGGPAHAGQREEDQHDQAVSFEEEGGAEGSDHAENADEDGLFPADAGGQEAHRDEHDDGGPLRDHQRQGKVAVRDVPDVLRVQRKGGGHGVVGHEPQKDRGQQEDHALQLAAAQPLSLLGRLVLLCL